MVSILEKIKQKFPADKLRRWALRTKDPEIQKEINKEKIEGMNAGCDVALFIVGANLLQCLYRVLNDVPNAWQMTISNVVLFFLAIFW